MDISLPSCMSAERANQSKNLTLLKLSALIQRNSLIKRCAFIFQKLRSRKNYKSFIIRSRLTFTFVGEQILFNGESNHTAIQFKRKLPSQLNNVLMFVTSASFAIIVTVTYVISKLCEIRYFQINW